MAKTKNGQLAVDDYLRVLKFKNHTSTPVGCFKVTQSSFVLKADGDGGINGTKPVSISNVYALGDCCANTSHPLPALAQV